MAFAILLNEALFTTGPGPNGVRHEHRTHFIGSLGKGAYTGTAGIMFRYLNDSPTQARVTIGPIFWLAINLNLLKKGPQTFVEYPEDHPTF